MFLCIALSVSFRLFFLSCGHREGIAIIHAPSTSTTKSFLSTSKSVSRPVSFVSASVPLPRCGRRLYTTAKRRINSQLESMIHLHRLQPVKDTEMNSIYSISRDFSGPTILNIKAITIFTIRAFQEKFKVPKIHVIRFSRCKSETSILHCGHKILRFVLSLIRSNL